MPYLDFHCHTSFSFDSEASPDDVCRVAINKGIKQIAFTDHCDYDCIKEGLYEPYDFEGVSSEISRLRDKYSDTLDISYGIELGGAHVFPQETESLVKKYGYDFVLGSLHNLRRVPDFSFIDFSRMPQAQLDSLLRRNISELCEIASLPFINSLAHITYPLRYYIKSGRSVNTADYFKEFTELFETVIANGVALEVNTSPLRNGVSEPMPSRELLALYRKCGGKLLTVGSDAHIASDVGCGINEALNMLDSLGFESVCTFGRYGRKDFYIKDILENG